MTVCISLQSTQKIAEPAWLTMADRLLLTTDFVAFIICIASTAALLPRRPYRPSGVLKLTQGGYPTSEWLEVPL